MSEGTSAKTASKPSQARIDSDPDKTYTMHTDDPDQTYIAHVENGVVKARVPSQDWTRYEKDNNL